MKFFTFAAVAGLLLGAVASADEAAIANEMAAGHAHDAPLATPASLLAPALPVVAEEVVYAEIEDEPVRGWLARPADGGEALPAIIVIHEWWGLNENIRQMTERLAGEGYVALAVDLYRGERAEAPREAMRLSQGLAQDMGPADENLRQAYRYLEQAQGAPRIAAIGWCLGGRWTLRTALLFPAKLSAAVIYYGSVRAEREELAQLQMPVLGIFAELDRVVPVAQVEAFREQMQSLGKQADIRIYPGVDHAFANPSGGEYDEAAAEEAWGLTVEFLARTLAGD
jgi:carboxymethylenebutenolidase